MDFTRIQVVFTVPQDHLLPVLEAAAAAGAGVLGAYTKCCFYHPGTGRFEPGTDANPTIGAVGQLEEVDEYRVETFCDRAIVRRVVKAIRAAHPYEEPAIYLLPLFYEADFPEESANVE